MAISRQDRREEVRALMAEVFKLDPAEIGPDFSFGDIPAWDSLGHMDLLMTLENRYGIQLSEETIAQLTSLQAVCQHLDRLEEDTDA